MKKFIILLLIITLNSGCVTFTSGSLPKIQEEEINRQYQKRDVSFSVSYYQQIGGDAIINEKSLKDTIRTSFQLSNLFKRIHYTTFESKSNYHYHFDFKMTGTPPNEQFAKAYFCGATLLLIPVWFNYYIDITMFLFVDGKEVFSATTAERVTDLVWLPLAITWIFANHATIGYIIRKQSFKYFTNEIKRNKLYLIPTSDNSLSSRPKDLQFLDKERNKEPINFDLESEEDM